jgi:hypothetical protein
MPNSRPARISKAKPPRLAITKADHIYAVTEWWRRYRDEPERFTAQFQVIIELNAAEAEGREPAVGENDWAYMNQILDERDAAKAKKLGAAANARPAARAKRSAAAKAMNRKNLGGKRA